MKKINIKCVRAKVPQSGENEVGTKAETVRIAKEQRSKDVGDEGSENCGGVWDAGNNSDRRRSKMTMKMREWGGE